MMARPEFDRLFEVLAPKAEHFIEEYGEFYPFACRILRDRTLAHAYAYDGDEHPESNELIELMLISMRNERESGEIVAAGICVDVSIAASGASGPIDAISCRLSHVDGEAIEVLIPYDKMNDGTVRYGDVIAQQMENFLTQSD